jgi:hypothetical protein
VTREKRIFEHDWEQQSGGGILDLEPSYWSECRRCGLIMNPDYPKTTYSKPDDDHVYRRCPKCKTTAQEAIK